MAAGVKGLGKGMRSTGRQMKSPFTRGDPIDMATGEMVMSATDVLLPGVLPLAVERHHRSGVRTGQPAGVERPAGFGPVRAGDRQPLPWCLPAHARRTASGS
ncbi:DUF6531 domain-containing protein [Streptomyces sp. NPDC041068]|uniref:DUF6531 domain-containing protein n=1 Tax=Streptomyces sp. NPDC041068 TaxID=3155130 RepID=UPI0033CA225A